MCHQILLASSDNLPAKAARCGELRAPSPTSRSFPGRAAPQPAFPSVRLQLTEAENQCRCSCHLPSHPLKHAAQEGISTLLPASPALLSPVVVFASPNCHTGPSAPSFALLVTAVPTVLVC